MLILLYYISPVKIFWCVKYYKAQPYNMEHTLCVCVQMQTMFQKLHIDNLDFTTLHTLIFFEDAANCKLFNRSTNYFNQLFTRLAHVQCSVFIAVQFWKSLPTEIKSNAGTVFIFPNFSKEQLRYILRQVPLPEEFERIYEKYQQLRDQQKLIVDINNQQLFIE